MSIPSTDIQVEEARTPRQWSAGLGFLKAHYQRMLGVAPSPPDHLLVAWRGTRVCGTIGVNVWRPDTGLRLLRLYTFDYGRTPFTLEPEATVEFSRLACEAAGVSCFLLHAATRFSLARGMTHALCEHSPAVQRACRRLGLILYLVPDARRDDTAIEEQHRAYYDHHDVRLSMFRLEDAQSGLEATLSRL